MVFPDGVAFRGAWQDDAWLQSAAEPRACLLRGPGLASLVAGSAASFSIQARDELGNPRLSGGDAFRVLLVPERGGAPAAALPPPPAGAAPPEAGALPAPAPASAAVPEAVVAVAAGEVHDHGDGSYTASYTHTGAGRYRLHVTNGRRGRARLAGRPAAAARCIRLACTRA